MENKTQRLRLYLLYLQFCTMENTIFTGKVYHCFDELSSTNDYAVQLIDIGTASNEKGRSENAGDALSEHPTAKSRPPEGTLIRAVNQSAGRGQFGSTWESAAGLNLTFSVVFYPTWLPPARVFRLNMVVALAVREVLESLRAACPAPDTLSPVRIKWPNDIYIGDEKCAGILIQNGLQGQQLHWSVAGIGLNVNQTDFSPLLPNPTSAARAFGRTFDLEQVMGEVWVRLERRYLQLKAGGDAALRALYESYLYRRAEQHFFYIPAENKTVEGMIAGVTEGGRLRLRTAEGERTFEVKEVRFAPAR